MTIRAATHDDARRIAELGEAMHADSSFADLDYSIEQVEHFVHVLIDGGQFACVAEHEGRVVGLMLGAAMTSFFGADLIANDFALYVVPEHRGGLDAVRMVQRFFGWALEKGAKQIRPGVSTGSAGAERMYERMGFERVGAAFVRRAGQGV